MPKRIDNRSSKIQLKFIHLWQSNPIRVLISRCFPTTSKSIALDLEATSSGFLGLLLKIKSFRANQIFHQKNFGMACQISLQSWLVEEILGYLFCQFAKRFTGSLFKGIETGSPVKRSAQAFWVYSQLTKLCSEVFEACLQKQHLKLFLGLWRWLLKPPPKCY